MHRAVYQRWGCPEVYDLMVWVSSLVKYQDSLDVHLARLRPDPFPAEGLSAEHLGVRNVEDGTRRVLDFLLIFGGDAPEMAYYTNDRLWRSAT